MTVLAGSASHRGGTLRLALPADDIPYSTDPTEFAGLAQWQLLSLTNDGLVTYRRAGGLAGGELVPDLATAIPQPTDGGRTYTFRLRDGIRYSNGAALQPVDIRRGIERTMRSGNGYLTGPYAGIVGGPRCVPRACDLRRGIGVDREAGTVTFHLTRADPEFLYKLAFAMASAVPPGKFGGRALPATGPYMTKSFTPNRSWVLVRTRGRGERPRQGQWLLIKHRDEAADPDIDPTDVYQTSARSGRTKLPAKSKVHGRLSQCMAARQARIYHAVCRRFIVSCVQFATPSGAAPIVIVDFGRGQYTG